MISSIFNYMPIAFQIIGYALLLITIYCCYEAYYKIRKNKGYIYIAIICFLLLLPDIIKMASSLFVSHAVRVEYSTTQRTSNTAISPLVEVKNVSVNLPLIELLLLLTVLKFSIKDDKDNSDKIALANHGSPDASL